MASQRDDGRTQGRQVDPYRTSLKFSALLMQPTVRPADEPSSLQFNIVIQTLHLASGHVACRWRPYDLVQQLNKSAVPTVRFNFSDSDPQQGCDGSFDIHPSPAPK